MGRRQYSDNDKATALAALDANGGNDVERYIASVLEDMAYMRSH